MAALAQANPDFLGKATAFWDPLDWGLSDATIGYLNNVEVDHGRVAMAASIFTPPEPTFQISAIQGITCADDSGWWCTVQNGVENTIEGLHDFLHDGLGIENGSWGLSIILFTALLRTLIFPLNYISYEATDRNKALKPYMDKIRERYADDQQALNLATAKLYEMTETNPLAGCLPSIAQIPVFIALYRSILNLAFEKKIGEGFLWLPNLEGPTYDNGRGMQWLTDNCVDGVPPLGWHDTLCFLALPAALVVAQSISMRVLTPQPEPGSPEYEASKNANRILKYLPLMIGYFSTQVPAGLGLYWMTSNVFSVGGSLGAKAYLKKNPPKLDVELRDLGIDDDMAGVKVPTSLEEALVDARLNARPNRDPIRPGINPVPAFLAIDTGSLDMGAANDIARVDEIAFVDELPDPAPEPAVV
jgi:YidC/Oxa1 family membrane protein insertase